MMLWVVHDLIFILIFPSAWWFNLTLLFVCLIRFISSKTTEKAIIRKEKHLEEEEQAVDEDEEIIYKIDVAANR